MASQMILAILQASDIPNKESTRTANRPDTDYFGVIQYELEACQGAPPDEPDKKLIYLTEYIKRRT